MYNILLIYYYTRIQTKKVTRGVFAYKMLAVKKAYKTVLCIKKITRNNSGKYKIIIFKRGYIYVHCVDEKSISSSRIRARNKGIRNFMKCARKTLTIQKRKRIVRRIHYNVRAGSSSKNKLPNSIQFKIMPSHKIG